MQTIYSANDRNLEPEDFKGWTALPSVTITTPNSVDVRPATFDDIDGTAPLPSYALLGAPYQPALVHWTEDEGQVIRSFPIIFDTKRECQEFIADHIIGAGFYPTEDFD